MAINESVQYALNQTSWKARTLVEVAQAGQLFLVTEAEFDRILEAEQLDEGVKEWIAKAREFAKKLPGNLQAAQQAVVKATGKALDASNTAYIKAQDIINKIPMIGRIPEQTRNRLMLGLALSFAAGMGTDASANDASGMDQDTGHAATGANTAIPGTEDPAGGNDGTPPAPAPAPAPAPGTEGNPNVTVTDAAPEPHASAMVHGREGNTAFNEVIKAGGAGPAGAAASRSQFFSIGERMASGDVTGAKHAASAFADRLSLDANSKKIMMDFLMKVGQTAKANGIKMK